MTDPRQHNCAHIDDGWCLDCLRTEMQVLETRDDAIRACAVALKMLLQHLPVVWGDHIEDGQLSLLVSADDIERAENAISFARQVVPRCDA